MTILITATVWKLFNTANFKPVILPIIVFLFRAAKEVKKTQKATKKPAAAATKAKTVKPATKSTKNVQKAAPRVGGKR